MLITFFYQQKKRPYLSDMARTKRIDDILAASFTTDECIINWINSTCYDGWKKYISEDELCAIIKKKAIVAQKKGEYDFTWIYRMEREIRDLSEKRISGPHKSGEKKVINSKGKKVYKRNHLRESILRIANEHKISEEAAYNIYYSKKAQKEKYKKLKEKIKNDIKLNRRIYYIENGVESYFERSKDAVSWYSKRFGCTYAGAKTAIFRGIRTYSKVNGIIFFKKEH